MKLAQRLRRSTRLSVAFLVFNVDGMGGTSRSTITQANALARRGNIDVRLISVMRTADAPHYWIDPAVGVDHLADARGDDPRAKRPSRLVPTRWDSQFSALTDDAMAALADLDVDLVVTVTPALMAAAVQLLPADTAVLHQEHRSSADRVGGMEPLLAFAPRVAAVALLTQSTAAWLGAELGAAAPELVVMPNPLPVAPQPRSELTSKTIVTAGRIVPEKQFIHLVRAFGEVADALPGWRLRILGDGPLRAELIAHAAKVGLADRIELPGAVSDMAPEWADAAICALSSKTEGFPLVAQEAMSAGVPVVSYDCPSGPRELVEHGVSGLLVGAGAKAGLAAALHEVASDASLLTRLGEGALAASRRYDADTIAAEWEALFTRISMGGMARDTPGGRAIPPMDIVPFTREGMPIPERAITPLEARGEALRLAITAADSAGPGWFVIPTHDRPAPTVVVPAAHRAAVLAALAEVPDHFSLLDPGDRGWPVRRLPARDLVAVLHNAAPNRIVLEPWPRSEGRRSFLGEDAGVEIEFWDRLPDGTLVAPRPNRWTQSVPPGTATTEVSVVGVRVPTLELMAAPTPFDVAFPIDVVYTWVDGDDPEWSAARAARDGADARQEAAGQARFRNRDELRYSLRSLHLF
ncbi:Stealth CR1 domain-containing protein, partial [Nocardioides sp.]|uniref:Stealth CR1 domain-containing protein n=1 Tax=Nocardioides sp. TaxID=35761 RepID=UPI00286DE696